MTSPYLSSPILTPRERAERYVEAALMARGNARTYRMRARQYPEDARGYEELARDAFDRGYLWLHHARTLRILSKRMNAHA